MRNYLREIKNKLESFGFIIVSEDLNRPWGEFLVIDEENC